MEIKSLYNYKYEITLILVNYISKVAILTMSLLYYSR